MSLLVLLCFLLGSLGVSPSALAQIVPFNSSFLGKTESRLEITIPMLKGVRLYPNDPLRFDFVLHYVQPEGGLGSSYNADIIRLIKYFLAALTVPEKDMWVNLSPYEKDRIVPEAFGRTGMGRDLLAQDYVLKQLTASLLNPDSGEGRRFWDKVYAKAREKFGTSDIPVEALNKVWIVPDKAEVFERNNAVYVTQARLKVMLDSDHEAMSSQPMPAMQADLRDILRDVIVPIIEQEINEGERFAQVRQVYNALILATWLKRKITHSPLTMYIDHNKTAALTVPQSPEDIWQAYVEVFKKGAANFIREETDNETGEVILRKYLTGGVVMTVPELLKAQDEPSGLDNAQIINARLNPIDQDEPNVVSQEQVVLLKNQVLDVSLHHQFSNNDFRRGWTDFIGRALANGFELMNLDAILDDINRVFPGLYNDTEQVRTEVYAALRQSLPDHKIDGFADLDQAGVRRMVLQAQNRFQHFVLPEWYGIKVRQLFDPIAREIDDYESALRVVRAYLTDTMTPDELKMYLSTRGNLTEKYFPDFNMQVQEAKRKVYYMFDLLEDSWRRNKNVMYVLHKDMFTPQEQEKWRELASAFNVLEQNDEVKKKAFNDQLFRSLENMGGLVEAAEKIALMKIGATKSAFYNSDYLFDLISVKDDLQGGVDRGLVPEIAHEAFESFIRSIHPLHSIDAGIQEMIDATSQMVNGSIGKTSVVELAFMRLFEKLKPEDVRGHLLSLNGILQSFGDEPLLDPDIDWEESFIEQPIRMIQALPDMLENMFYSVVKSDKRANRILRQDPYVVSHSVGYALAVRGLKLVNDEPRRLALLLGMMLKEGDPRWFSDYRLFWKNLVRWAEDEARFRQLDRRMMEKYVLVPIEAATVSDEERVRHQIDAVKVELNEEYLFGTKNDQMIEKRLTELDAMLSGRLSPTEHEREMKRVIRELEVYRRGLNLITAYFVQGEFATVSALRYLDADGAYIEEQLPGLNAFGQDVMTEVAGAFLIDNELTKEVRTGVHILKYLPLMSDDERKKLEILKNNWSAYFQNEGTGQMQWLKRIFGQELQSLGGAQAVARKITLEVLAHKNAARFIKVSDPYKDTISIPDGYTLEQQRDMLRPELAHYLLHKALLARSPGQDIFFIDNGVDEVFDTVIQLIHGEYFLETDIKESFFTKIKMISGDEIERRILFDPSYGRFEGSYEDFQQINWKEEWERAPLATLRVMPGLVESLLVDETGSLREAQRIMEADTLFAAHAVGMALANNAVRMTDSDPRRTALMLGLMLKEAALDVFLDYRKFEREFEIWARDPERIRQVDQLMLDKYFLSVNPDPVARSYDNDNAQKAGGGDRIDFVRNKEVYLTWLEHHVDAVGFLRANNHFSYYETVFHTFYQELDKAFLEAFEALRQDNYELYDALRNELEKEGMIIYNGWDVLRVIWANTAFHPALQFMARAHTRVVGWMYSTVGRYDRQYLELEKVIGQQMGVLALKYKKTGVRQTYRLGVIGPGMGFEPIEMVMRIFEQRKQEAMFAEVPDDAVEFKVVVMDREHAVFRKFQHNEIYYPGSLFERTRWKDHQGYFLKTENGFIRGKQLNEVLEYIAVDLSDPRSLRHIEDMDGVLIHNVLQYILPEYVNGSWMNEGDKTAARIRQMAPSYESRMVSLTHSLDDLMRAGGFMSMITEEPLNPVISQEINRRFSHPGYQIDKKDQNSVIYMKNHRNNELDSLFSDDHAMRSGLALPRWFMEKHLFDLQAYHPAVVSPGHVIVAASAHFDAELFAKPAIDEIVRRVGVGNTLELMGANIWQGRPVLSESYLDHEELVINKDMQSEENDVINGFIDQYDEIILSGGAWDKCHANRFRKILNRKITQGKRVVIHLPLDAIYPVENKDIGLKNTQYKEHFDFAISDIFTRGFGKKAAIPDWARQTLQYLRKQVVPYAVFYQGERILGETDYPQVIVNVWDSIPDIDTQSEPFSLFNWKENHRLEDVVRQRAVVYESLIDEKVPVFQSTYDFIRGNANAWLQWGVGSASLSTRKVLTRLGLASYFNVIVDGVDAQAEQIANKPSPEFYKAVARKMGLNPSDLVVIGDSYADMLSASGGGFGLVIGIDREGAPDQLKNAGAHFVISDMREMSMEKIRGILPNVKGIILDNDGVIVDTESLYFKASQRVFNDYFRYRSSEFGEPYKALTLEESDRYLKGTGPVEGVRNLLAARGINIDFAQRQSAEGQVGGIDLNAEHLAINAKGDFINLNIDQAMVQRMRDAKGFQPVILSVSRLEKLHEFFGAAVP